MKKHLLLFIATAIPLLIANSGFAQAPTLGTAAGYVLFTSNGGLGNSGVSLLNGNVGTHNGMITGFGNVDGVMHNADGATTQGVADLLIAYNQLNGTSATLFLAPLLGDGQILTPGVYSVSQAATLNGSLVLDALNNANAVFIIKIQGGLTTNSGSSISLLNGALACNVFWQIEGAVTLATNTTMKGTIVANNAAIVMNTGCVLEGRALSTNGAITIIGTKGNTPTGCGSPVLTGPAAPAQGSTLCYALFSANGNVTNTGITTVTGEIGTNAGVTSGFNAMNVTGNIHLIPDASTAACASDLLGVYNYLNTLAFEIELLFPAQFGNNLVLTPHTYRMNSAVSLTDIVYLDAQGNANAVFVIQITGALTAAANSKVLLLNGAQAKNVFWKIDGAVTINDLSVFEGTIICGTGSINLNTGASINGRVLTSAGTLTTAAISTIITPGCTITSDVSLTDGKTNDGITFYPNPFSSSTTLIIDDASENNEYDLFIFNSAGKKVISTVITQLSMTLQRGNLVSGVYFFQLINENKIVRSGKLIVL